MDMLGRHVFYTPCRDTGLVRGSWLTTMRSSHWSVSTVVSKTSNHNDKTVLTSKLKVVNLFEHRAHQCTGKRQETMLATVHVLGHITCTVGSVCVCLSVLVILVSFTTLSGQSSMVCVNEECWWVGGHTVRVTCQFVSMPQDDTVMHSGQNRWFLEWK